MRALLFAPLFWLMALPALADARLTVLVDVLRLQEAAQILRDEGLRYGAQLNDEMLNGQGGAAFQVQVDAIYDAPRMVEGLRRALAVEMEGALLEDAIAFYGSELGQKIVSLENSARIAIGDKEIEALARAKVEEAQAKDSPRLALIRKLVDSDDLITRNVTSALNSNYQFMRGLAEGGALDMTDEEILADVAGETEEITEDTTGWLLGYFLMAYHPLTGSELDSYITFTQTPAGDALNRALFDGFGKAYEDISYGLGRAVALNMTAQDL